MRTVEFHVDPAHPAFAGHFPGWPILPGVVLLDQVMRVIEAAEQADDADQRDVLPFVTRFRLAICKFHRPAAPGAQLTIRIDRQPSGSIAFTVKEAEQAVASGSFAPITAPA